MVQLDNLVASILTVDIAFVAVVVALLAGTAPLTGIGSVAVGANTWSYKWVVPYVVATHID